VKVIEPTPMLREVAAAIASVRERVTAIGATAMQIALSEDLSVVTPTFDVDLAMPGGNDANENARRIINALKSAELTPSEEAGEAGFTWLGAASKV
jgi:hypothetical protein